MTYWEKLTDGLQLHEVAMFVLGGLLFMVLLSLIVLFALQKRQLRPLLLFFIVPVVMVGWPSIAKIQINGAGIALENTLRHYESNPADPEIREELQARVDNLENKGVKNPSTLITIAKANYLLGEDRDALQTLDRIPKSMKESVGADTLKATILVTQDIKRKLQQAAQEPTADNLEILRVSKDQLREQAMTNVRLHQYVKRSDSLIRQQR